MNEAIAEKICAHIACGCEVEPGAEFCSPHCEKARDETDCACGHADCRAKA